MINGALMNDQHQPFIPAALQLPEITLRVIILSILLTLLLATSNAYLALKIGILTSASIPAAIISMGVLRFFKNSNILENNLVQTAASAGEAVAGGVVYTVPALIIIGYWHKFSYWESLLIALLGGTLGVLFSVPLRRLLVSDRSLRFPEGRAIAELLKTSTQTGMAYIVKGGLVGAGLELCQTGFKLIASSWEIWLQRSGIFFGFGAGFSAAMIGAGYLIGFQVACSILLGAILGWGIGVPVISSILPHSADTVASLWNTKIRYIGIGGMLFAGIWTLLSLSKPLLLGINASLQLFRQNRHSVALVPRTERDIPVAYNLLAIIGIAILLAWFFYLYFPVEHMKLVIVPLGVLYILLIGFIFSGICGYFSGLVGVSASPGSSIIIAGMLLISLILCGFNFNEHQVQFAEATAIIIGSVLTGVASIANDNLQDLKVGYILGATPWKQQLMLLLGVVVSALVIPPIMQLLFNVYGLAGVMPHAGMNPATSLPAPPAAMMAAITAAVFHHNLPWKMLLIGFALIAVVVAINAILQRVFKFRLSILGLAIGVYLPLASSIPLFIGGLIAWLANRKLTSQARQRQRGILLACGLVAGAALMDVLLAIPFSMLHSPDALKLVGDSWSTIATWLGVVELLGLGIWFCWERNTIPM